MKPTHTKFLARYEAEMLSKICLATQASEVVFDRVWVNDKFRGDEVVAYAPTLEPKYTALISINSPNGNDPKEAYLRAHDDGPPEVDGFWQPLKLLFHDVDAPGQWWTEEEIAAYTEKYVVFDEIMAGQVLDYLIKAEQSNDVYAVWAHCQGGVSRSAGVSKFVADVYKLYFPEKYILYNKHVYSTLRSVYNGRVLRNEQVPGDLYGSVAA